MGYDLGVDLGGTAVAAADHTDSRAEMVPLGDGSIDAPAVVYRDVDGTLLVGDAAAQLAVEHPDRAGRDLRRRLGSSTPVRLGGQPYPPAALLGTLLQDVLDRVAETLGSKPDRVALTHPAHWSPARREAFTEAIRAAGLPEVRTVTEPEAVTAHYAAAGRLAEGDTVAVYDLGGGSFDATVLRRTGRGVELLGLPEGIERLGGGAFDEAILSHVNQLAEGPLTGLDRRDPQHAAAVARLRQACTQAKHTLSAETDSTIPVLLPNRQVEVTLTRPEFEQMIRSAIETTIGSLLKALQAAQVEPGELAAVLLVGGSTRIPLVKKMIKDALARPVVLDEQPKHPVALGAAILAATEQRAESAPTPIAVPAPRATADRAPAPVGARTAAGPAANPPNGHRTTSTAGISLFDPVTPVTAVNPTGDVGAARTTTITDAPPATDPPTTAFEAIGVTGPVTDATAAATTTTAPTTTAGNTAVPITPTVLDRPSTSPRATTDRPVPGFLVAEHLVGLDPPTQRDPVPGLVPPGPTSPATGSGSGRRGRLALIGLAAAALVAVLVAAGFAVWTQLPGSPGAPPAAQPAPAAPGGPPASAAASVAEPRVVATVPVGETPGFVVVSPDGRRAMVANQAAGMITVLDTATNEVTATIPVRAGPPQYLAFSPTGERVYVSIWDQARTVAAVGVLDTATNTIVATIPVRTRPYLSAVTPDGQRLYVPNHDSGTISVIDTVTNAVTTEIKVAPNPHWVEMSRDGSRAYAANHESNLVSVIDTSDNSILAEVPVQTSPHSLAVHPTRPLVANVNYDAASVTAIDTGTDRVVATIAVGKNPQDITWAPDGRHAYVVNSSDNTVSVIDPDTAEVTATVPTGTSPTSVAVLPDGSAAYVSNLGDGTLSVLGIAG
ncbi:MAG TPA: Hsp70 family protein [Pseudonocardia sp.]|nr:Hsp70 family protein [Pseudonocardia sp.]